MLAEFLLIVRWLILIGCLVCLVALVVAVWRMAMAHESIAGTLRVALLGKESEPSPPEHGPTKTAKCLLCQAAIPAGQIKCPACSWSDEDTPAKVAERLKDQGKL